MKKWNIRGAACFMTACMLFCSCGESGGTILIGSADSRTAEGQGKENAGGENTSGQAEAPEETETPFIRIYVCGAVKNPGVVEIPAGSRAEDALSAAGGFAEDAAQAAVNLAEWVTDGQKLYFPAEEEAEAQSVQEVREGAGLININTADVTMLCTLPGIGESRAADIIAYREANGGFESCEDIMKVAGIKNAVYEKIKDKITVK